MQINQNQKKNPDTSGLVKKLNCNANISGIATNAAITAVENKIPNISSLAEETDYNTKITEIEKKLTDQNHDKYITTPEFNKLTGENFAARKNKQIQ